MNNENRKINESHRLRLSLADKLNLNNPNKNIALGIFNNYQQTSKVLLTFVQNQQFGQLINIAPQSLTMLGTTNTKFSFIEVWFTDQNSEPLEIEDNVNLTLIFALTL